MRHVYPCRLAGLVMLLCVVLPTMGAAPSRSATPAVSWAQAWPMDGHDPQRTGRSPATGPLTPRLLWTYSGMRAPVVLGPDDTLYGWSTTGLIALNASGKRRWLLPVHEGFGGPPALDAEGTLRVSADVGSFFSGTGRAVDPHTAWLAVSPQGRRLWTIGALPWATVPQSVPFSKGVAPLVTAAGLFYVPLVGPAHTPRDTNRGVEVVSPRGVPLRRLFADDSGPIAVAPNGTVYLLGSDYAGQTALRAGRSDGRLLWQRDVGAEQSGSVVVGRDGTVYVSDGAGWNAHDAAEIAAYTPGGRLLWRRARSGGVAALAERGDGTLLTGDAQGLTAISAGGERLWHFALGHAPTTPGEAPSLAVDAAGNTYVGSADGRVRAVTPAGRLRWTVRAGGPTRLGSVPAVALGASGVLAVVGTDGILRVYL
jgi:outer membrane protein assembly factor BamB